MVNYGKKVKAQWIQGEVSICNWYNIQTRTDARVIYSKDYKVSLYGKFLSTNKFSVGHKLVFFRLLIYFFLY